MAKGQENVDKTMDICRGILSALDKMPSGSKASTNGPREQINRIIEGLQEISGKFFLKSNPSIPPTVACLKRAGELAGTLPEAGEEKDLTKFLNALEGFEKVFESLNEKASMRSTIIT